MEKVRVCLVQKLISIFLCFLMIICGFPIGQVEAASDTTPPTVNSVSISKNIGMPGDFLTVTVDADDDISGIENPLSIIFDPPSGNAYKCAFLYLNSSGTYSGNISIGENDAPGMWKARCIGLTDNAGNSTYVYNKEIYSTMPNTMDLSKGNFQVQGTVSDTTPPTVNSVSISKNIGMPGGILTVTVDADDDISGIENPLSIIFDPPSGNAYKCTFLYLNSSGTYSGNISIGENDAPGMWKARCIGLTDNAGNSTYVYNKETYSTMLNTMDLSKCNFQVQETVSDTTPPTVNSVSISKNTGVPGDILTVTVDADDDISGIENPLSIIFDPPSGNAYKCTFLYLNSSGTYSGNISIGENDALGMWKVRCIGLTDNAGNSTYVYNKETYPTMPNTMDLSKGDLQVKEATVNIIYKGNGSTDGKIPIDINTYSKGSTATVLGNTGLLTKQGYTFKCWNTQADGNGTDYAAGETFAIEANMTLYAKWTVNKYTVTFNSKGGSTVSGKIADYNNLIKAPTVPTRAGYTFGGWYKEADCINPWNFAKDKVTSNTTLYAKWTINKYTVKFNSQGGSAVSSKIANYNNLIKAPTVPARAGYTFGGWYKEADCINPWNFAKDKVTSNTTLYAKWIINKYTVKFNSQGGSAVSGKIADYNNLIKAPIVPTRAGYTFGGWYKEAGCINPWNFAKDKVTSNTMLYAKWTINKYTIKFNSQGGSIVSSKIANYNNLIIAPTVPTKTGYIFGGWYKESSCINLWNFTKDKVTSNKILYAKWIIKK